MACKTTTRIESTGDDYIELFRGEEIRTETIRVTPEIAKSWLTRNVINRALSEKHVDDLVWEVKNGKWKLTHQGIAFNVLGELIDGQHRLHAIIRANLPMDVRVTFNVEGGYDSPIDNGRVRRVHDILRCSSRDVAICNALLTLERTPRTRGGSASRIDDAFAQHRVGVEWAKKMFPFQRGITASLVAAHAYAYPVAPRPVEKFATQFLAHTGASSNEPAIALHRYIERSSRATVKGRDLSLAALKCVEAYCKGKTLARLSVNDDGLTYFAEQRAAKGL
jgi:hypothetical protein